VAKDGVHPFVVEVQGRRLVAIGTAFDVRLDADRIQVTMVEGTVRIESLRCLTKLQESRKVCIPRMSVDWCDF
jgi:ferric-dicitrate binding protein FerR (iron transport regulator)